MNSVYRMIDSLLVAAVFTILASPLCAFPSGAPTSACKTLEPDHTSPTTCGRNCPFKLSLIAIDNRTVPNPTTYRCGAVHKREWVSRARVKFSFSSLRVFRMPVQFGYKPMARPSGGLPYKEGRLPRNLTIAHLTSGALSMAV